MNLGDPSPDTVSYPLAVGNPAMSPQSLSFLPTSTSCPISFNLYRAVFRNPNGGLLASILYLFIVAIMEANRGVEAEVPAFEIYVPYKII